MPGFNAKQLNYNVLNANQVVITVGDAVVAFAQTSPHTIDFGTEAIFGIGDATPQEIQQLRILPTVTLEYMTLTQAGQNLLLNGTKGLDYQLGNTQFNIHVIDGQTQQVVFTYVDAVAQTYTQTVSANRPVFSTVVFLAMDVLGPEGNTLLASNSFISPGNFVTAAANQTGLGISI